MTKTVKRWNDFRVPEPDEMYILNDAGGHVSATDNNTGIKVLQPIMSSNEVYDYYDYINRQIAKSCKTGANLLKAGYIPLGLLPMYISLVLQEDYDRRLQTVIDALGIEVVSTPNYNILQDLPTRYGKSRTISNLRYITTEDAYLIYNSVTGETNSLGTAGASELFKAYLKLKEGGN